MQPQEYPILGKVILCDGEIHFNPPLDLRFVPMEYLSDLSSKVDLLFPGVTSLDDVYEFGITPVGVYLCAHESILYLNDVVIDDGIANDFLKTVEDKRGAMRLAANGNNSIAWLFPR